MANVYCLHSYWFHIGKLIYSIGWEIAKEITQNVSAAIETQCKSQASETQGALQRVTPRLRPAARCIRGEMAKEIVIKSIGCYMFLFSLIMNPKVQKNHRKSHEKFNF